VLWIRIQHFKSGSGYGFDDQKFIKNSNLLFPRPPQRTSNLQEKPSALKREHPTLQKRKFIHFFLFLLVGFICRATIFHGEIQIKRRLNPDPYIFIPVLEIRIRIRMFLGLPNPAPDPDPSLFKKVLSGLK
jgi:hypothetical protein